MVRRAALLLVAATALAACEGDPQPWKPPHDARINMTLTLEDRVEPPADGPVTRRRVEVQLLGAWRKTGVAELRVARLELRRQDPGVPEVELVAGETPENPALLSRRDLAQLGVLSPLRGAVLTFEIDAERGLTGIAGLDEVLDEGRPDGGPELDAWVALRRVFDARRWVARLRAAGMGAVPERQRDQLTERSRDTELEVPGRGRTSVSLTGRMAEESEGSPVLQLEGQLPPVPAFTGEAEETPAVLGSVSLLRVKPRAETMYLIDAGRPLRGNHTVRFPFQSGHTLTEHVSFTLLVTP